ncbi:MAG: hypothetical protein PHZ00_01515, partial [Candidatus Peribacteraceae bacterium]|nr:hypothetical protein [Candidatus Peribacteraceae bacterium]
GDRRVYYGQLIRPSTGEVVYNDVGGFGVAGGGHTYAGYGYDPAAPFPSLTKLSRTEILPLTAEKVAQIDALKKELAALEAATDAVMEEEVVEESVVSQEEEITSLMQQIADLENSHETVTRIPSLTVTAFQRDTGNLTLTYTSMPADVAFRFGNQTLALPEGSGSVRFPLSAFSHGDRRVYYGQLIRPSTGEVVYNDVGGFGVAGGGHTYAGYGYDPASPNPALANLAYKQTLPLTPEQVAMLEALKKELATAEAAADAVMEEESGVSAVSGETANVTEDPVASLRRQILDLENSREKVTVAPGLTITAYGNDAAHLTLDFTAMPEDVAFRFGNRTLALPKGSGTLRFSLIAFNQTDRIVYNTQLIRASTGEVIYDNLGGFGVMQGKHTYGNNPSSPNPALTKLSYPEVLPLPAEEERMLAALRVQLIDAEVSCGLRPPEPLENRIERIIRPSLQILLTERANVTVGFSSPGEQICLELEGGGFIGRRVLNKKGGFTFDTETMTMHAANPSGIYVLRLSESPGGKPLADVLLSWDQTTHTLTPAGSRIPFSLQASLADNGRLTGEELYATLLADEQAQMTAVESVVAREQSLSGVSQSVISSPLLDNPQGKGLIASQRFNLMRLAAEAGKPLPNYYNGNLWTPFLNTFPQWREENKDASIITMRTDERNFYYSREETFKQYLSCTDAFNEAEGRMIEAGMNAVLAMRAGGDAQVYLRTIDIVLTEFNPSVSKLQSIGATLPTKENVLDACVAILENQAAAFLADLASADQAVRNAEYNINHNPSYAGSGTCTPAITPVPDADRQAFLDQLYAAQKALPMYASDGVTVIGMGGQVYPQKTVAGQATAETPTGSALSGTHVANFMNESTAIRDLAAKHFLIPQNGVFPTSQEMLILRNSVGSVIFQLPEESMVNFWVDMNQFTTLRTENMQTLPGMDVMPDISLTLIGSGISTSHISDKKSSLMAAESISLRLPAGTYTIIAHDKTNYQTALFEDHPERLSLPKFNVGIDIQPYKTQRIEGRISIPSRPMSTEVRMSVAEFNSNGQRNVDYNGEHGPRALDPTKPVWVVVHGRTDHENSDAIKELTRSLSAHDIQVATLDWSEGAKDNSPDLFGLQGSNWIARVGAWAADQLKTAGFVAANVNAVGHSWGSYVAYEIAKNFGSNINVLVTLDPAKDTILSGYDESQADFSQYSAKSLALHSSFYGEEDRALTANYAIRVIDEDMSRPSIEHGYAVTAFSSLLQSGHNTFDPVAAQFTPMKLMTADPAMKQQSGWDGTLKIVTTERRKEDGSEWWKALPQTLEYTDALTNSTKVDRVIGNHFIS